MGYLFLAAALLCWLISIMLQLAPLYIICYSFFFIHSVFYVANVSINFLMTNYSYY